MSTPASTAFRRGVHLFNTERGHDAIAGHSASQGFIDAILGEIEHGYGFVPFAGAGFSVSAGIPIINQFSNYLQRCICVAVGAETDCERPQLWNPRTDKWPPFIDLSRPEPPPVPWRDLVYKRFQAEDLLPKDKGNPWIYQEAFGAMAEWRTSLYFLSRLNLDSPRLTKSKTPTPVLGVPDQDVIDACLRQVLRANVPSLNHAMLATLSQLLRIDTILTTNFDDLIEKAFLDSRNRLEVFDVHLGDRLPDYAAVSRVRSIVKIHGSQNSLRADYSLDGPPSYEDMCMFASYVAGWDMIRLKGTHGSRNHLLIFGVGVTEQRTRGFLKHALDRLPDLKLFFVCYRNEDVEAVRTFMEGCIGEGESDSEKPPRCYVLRHTESGLLLLHLYQSVRKSLPVNSALFPSTTRLSLPVLPHLSCDFESDQDYKDFREGIPLALREESPTRPHLIVATSPNGISGVTSAAAEVLRDIESRNLCLWIEMHDIHSADDLFEAFQEAAHYKLGRSDWTPLYSANDGRPREEEIQRIMDSSTSPIVIFLDARETPGANLESEQSDFKDARDNGWLDGGAKPEDSKKVESFVNLIEQWISRPRHGVNRITVILLCRGAHPPIVRSLSGLPAHILSLQKGLGTNAVTAWDVDEIVCGALWWAETNEKRTFLQSIVSMQRTRHLAVIWDASVSVPHRSGRKTDEERTRWLDQLEEKKVLRRKDGGFVWVDSRYRQKIRACLTLTSDQIQQTTTDPSLFLRWVGVPLPRGLAGEDLLNRLMEWKAVEKQAEIQRSIAMWYLKVFDATGTSRAILEAADHLCYSAASLIRGQKFPEAIGRLASIRHLLKKHSFRIQTEGHPCSSKRRLDVICNYWTKSGVAELITRPGWVCDLEEQDKLKKSIAKLQCASLEVTRAICREIGEDRDAYKRHREIGIRSVISEPLNCEQVVLCPIFCTAEC